MRRTHFLLGGLAALALISACGPAEAAYTPTPTVPPSTPSPEPTATVTSTPAPDCSKGYIALTFDDGPFPGQTEQLLAALNAAGLRATFFDLGKNLAGNDSLVKAQMENGWVGNHSWSHTDMTQATNAEILAELKDTQDTLQKMVGEAPQLFRPPYLKTSPALKDVEKGLGLTEVMTIIDSKDWAGVSADEIVANVSTAWSGVIVLMHDNLSTTREAIPRIAEFMVKNKLCSGKIDPATGKMVAP